MGDEQHLFHVYRHFSCMMSSVLAAFERLVVRITDVRPAAPTGLGLRPSREAPCLAVAVGSWE